MPQHPTDLPSGQLYKLGETCVNEFEGMILTNEDGTQFLCKDGIIVNKDGAGVDPANDDGTVTASETPIYVDGYKGTVIPEPMPENLEQYRIINLDGGTSISTKTKKLVMPSFGHGAISSAFPELISSIPENIVTDDGSTPTPKLDPIRAVLQCYWSVDPGFGSIQANHGPGSQQTVSLTSDTTSEPEMIVLDTRVTEPTFNANAGKLGQWTQELRVVLKAPLVGPPPVDESGVESLETTVLRGHLVAMTYLGWGGNEVKDGIKWSQYPVVIPEGKSLPQAHLDSAVKNNYIDSVFLIDRPPLFPQLESEKTGGNLKTSHVTTDPVYNFYLCDYEEKTEPALLPLLVKSGWKTEKLRSDVFLPNAYTILQAAAANTHGADPYAQFSKWAMEHNKIGFFHHTYKPKIDSKTLSLSNLGQHLSNSPINFLRWQQLKKDRPWANNQFFKKKVVAKSDILFLPDDKLFFKSVKDMIDKFPMYVNISFPSIGETKFIEILEETNFFMYLARWIWQTERYQGEYFELIKLKEPESLVGAEKILENFYGEGTIKLDQSLGRDTFISGPEHHVSHRVNMQYFHLSDALEVDMNLETSGDDEVFVPASLVKSPFVQAMKPGLKKPSDPPSINILRKRDKKGGKLLQSLLSVVFFARLKKYAKEHVRSFEQILQGKTAHNETMMYELVKLDKNLNKIQTIFLPQTTGIVEYLDTQVKYGKDYIYQIYAHQIVVATKYKYHAVNNAWAPFASQGGASDSHFQIGITYEPELLIYRVPYYNGEDFLTKRPTSITDSPPLPPEVVIYPIFGEANKIIFAMNTSIGHQKMKPVFLSPGEQFDEKVSKAFFNTINTFTYTKSPLTSEMDFWYESFDFGTLTEKTDPFKSGIIYSSDDDRGVFEIYRIDTKPETYEDFSPLPNTLIAEFDSRKQRSFIDKTIEPNRKYYYTCRAKDAHGNMSNPTPVYEVELIDVGAGIYPSIKVLDTPAKKKVDAKPRKSFKKYILIRPQYLQDSVVDVDPKSGVPLEVMWPNAKEGSENLQIGEMLNSVFARKFKARVTSKRTGKKIDFNFKVKITEKMKNKSEEKC